MFLIKIRNILIILACMMITYIYVRNVGIYQAKEINSKVDSGENQGSTGQNRIEKDTTIRKNTEQDGEADESTVDDNLRCELYQNDYIWREQIYDKAAVRTVGESVTDGEEAVQTAEASAIEETETSESGESTTTEMSEDENKETGWDVDFEIKREAYHCNEERNDINIYYPQLTGFVDAAKEERINALIQEDAKKWIGETNKEGDDSLYCLNLDYEVKFLNDRMISILYKGRRGYFMPKDAKLRGKAVATTIDMEEEKVIALKDIADASKLGDMLLADEFQNITMWDGSIPELEASTVISIYEQGLEADLQERHSWYTDGEHFIIVLADPKFSDYLEYSIDIESVSHILDETFLKKLE